MSENPPAFPRTRHTANGIQIEPGMTLRDWFAGQALGMLPYVGEVALSPSEWAHDAYAIADAMLAHREQTQ